MTIQELIDEIPNLPVEMRVQLVDKILETLNPNDTEIGQAWAQEAQRRLKTYQENKVKAIPGEKVMNKAIKKAKR